MQSYLNEIAAKLEQEGLRVPNMAITGGFVTEDQVYKALALGGKYLSAVGICRASMAAAMNGKKIGELLEAGKLPAELQRFGSTKDELSWSCGNCGTSTAMLPTSSLWARWACIRS